MNFKAEAEVVHSLAQHPGIRTTVEEFRITWKFILRRIPWNGVPRMPCIDGKGLPEEGTLYRW